MKPVRVSAKALIIEDGKLLCIKKQDDDGFYYLLPGGGQQPGENLVEAVQRECLEEVSAYVTVHELRFVRDYIGKHHEFAEWDSGHHQVELMFRCTLQNGTNVELGSEPDVEQVGIEWLDLDKLEDYRLYPKALRPLIQNYDNTNGSVYMGDVN